MAWNLVQSAEGTSTSATTSPTFSSTPTSGNLIILRFAADDYNGTPNTGWTQSTGMEQQSFHGSYLWWQESTGSQPPSYTIGSATNSSWTLEEWEFTGGTWAYNTSNGQFASSSGSTYTTPSITPETAETNGTLLLASMGGSTTSVDCSPDLSSWLNSFTHSRSSGPVSASGTWDIVGGGYRIVTGNGSTGYSSGATYPNSMQSRSGLIISFTGTSSGGATITADAGSYAVTGTAANLEVGHIAAAAAGSYAVSGTAASLEVGYVVAADAGSYAITGSDAGLSQPDKVIAAAAGSYAVTGSDASLETGHVVSATSGSYAVTGGDVTLTVGAAGDYTIAADAGSYAISGTAASLEQGHVLSPTAGSYAVTGSSVNLRIVQPQTAPVISDIDGFSRRAKEIDREQREREDREDADKRKLREIVETAYRQRVEGEPPKTVLPAKERKRIVREVARPMIDEAGVKASLKEIERSLQAIELEILAAADRAEEEAMIILMVA